MKNKFKVLGESLAKLTNLELPLSPEECCSGTIEILGKHGDNKRQEIFTEKGLEYRHKLT